MGIISPVGNQLQDAWHNVCNGVSGIRLLEHFDTSDLPTRIGGIVENFDVSDYLPPKEARKMDPFVHYGIAASVNAIADSGLEITEENGHTIGIAMGAGIGGLKTIEDTHSKMLAGGPRKVSPFFIPGSIINMTSGYVSILQKITGPNVSIVTACATSAHCIGFAGRMIQHGDAEVMLAGGSEYATTPLAMAGFCAARAMSTNNDDPTGASRPYDVDRDGFVLSNGAGCVVLEELEHAKARGAKIYAEVTGYGLSGDAYHVTAPHPEGKGAELAMKMALKKAGLGPGDIDYVNAHGTSTMADTIELAAVSRVLGEGLGGASMSSTKSAIGHLLGGAGAVEAVFCVLALRDQIVPPTLNLHDPDEGTEGIDLVPLKSKEREVRAVLNNSFGFGGTNASLIMQKVEG